MNLNFIPDYCERISGGVFAEPLNLSTNLFIIASTILVQRKLIAAKVAHRSYIQFLIIMVTLLGIGSAVFHATPNHFTLLLDAVPIYIFVLSALTFMLKHLSGSWKYATGLTTAVATILILASIYVPASFLNGSKRHIVVLVCLVGLFYWCWRKYGRLTLRLIPVLVLYASAITARSIDQLVCSAIPFGTHFIWHTFNAVACYFVISFLIIIDAETTIETR